MALRRETVQEHRLKLLPPNRQFLFSRPPNPKYPTPIHRHLRTTGHRPAATAQSPQTPPLQTRQKTKLRSTQGASEGRYCKTVYRNPHPPPEPRPYTASCAPQSTTPTVSLWRHLNRRPHFPQTTSNKVLPAPATQ